MKGQSSNLLNTKGPVRSRVRPALNTLQCGGPRPPAQVPQLLSEEGKCIPTSLTREIEFKGKSENEVILPSQQKKGSSRALILLAPW